MKDEVHVILGVTGSVAGIKVPELVEKISKLPTVKVKVLTTEKGAHFFKKEDVPQDVEVLEHEDFSAWKSRGDPIAHIDLREWGDILLIAPLDANTLAKIAGGICDNFLLCVVRAWNPDKVAMFAPAMNTRMWESPLTAGHVERLTKQLNFTEIPCVEKTLMCGETGAMASVDTIVNKVADVIGNDCKPTPAFSIDSELTLGKMLAEGKTKKIYEVFDKSVKSDRHVMIESKDRITAGDGARAHDLEGKAAISTKTTTNVFKYLAEIGIRTHFVKQVNDISFVADNCDMIPIEWVTRRVATGSFLRRHPGVNEGYRFTPPKIEFFFKDDENHDPQWSYEQIVEKGFVFGGVSIGKKEVDHICKMMVTVFEVLEKAWSSLNCSLIDMKVEFGVTKEGEILLADIIDNDSWRLWPSGDRRLMKDKQVYRELKQVTDEALQLVKKNFTWVATKTEEFVLKPAGRVVILMGSLSDRKHCEDIQAHCVKLGVPSSLRVSSAHKGTDDTMAVLAQCEGDGIPTVFIAVAGRSNGLGPVLSGNTSYPVINCPPVKSDWGAQDIWSSLRLPSGLGCCTVLSPEGAALQAAQILAMFDHVIWSRLRAVQTNTKISLMYNDATVRQ